MTKAEDALLKGHLSYWKYLNNNLVWRRRWTWSAHLLTGCCSLTVSSALIFRRPALCRQYWNFQYDPIFPLGPEVRNGFTLSVKATRLSSPSYTVSSLVAQGAFKRARLERSRGRNPNQGIGFFRLDALNWATTAKTLQSSSPLSYS